MVMIGMVMIMTAMLERVTSHNYKDALTKSILFFEGQRSGKLPSSQRLTWRKDSGLRDGFEIGVSFITLLLSNLFKYCFYHCVDELLSFYFFLS